jgi:hypothetical protein
MPPPTSEGHRAFRYELVLSGTEGARTARAVFSLDLAGGQAASVSFSKNVRWQPGTAPISART